MKKHFLNNQDFNQIKNTKELKKHLEEQGFDTQKVLDEIEYDKQLENLQIELLKLQAHIIKEKRRVVIIFEGRDASGKGGTIKRFIEHLNPRSMRVVALTKPTESEKSQWFMARYIKTLPKAGEIVFYDRSWYNRAVVEPTMGFCTENQYHTFMRHVSNFEHMIYEDGIVIIKFWFSIHKNIQVKRFHERKINPLKQWKLSPVDEKSQEYWDRYSYFKEQMFSKTHTPFSPWIIVKGDVKKLARLESIRYVLSQFEYEGKEQAYTRTNPDPNIVSKFAYTQLNF